MGKGTAGVGNGTFKAPDFNALPPVANPVSIAAGDFKGGAEQDLAVVDSGGPVYLLIGKGTGKFKQPQMIGLVTLPRPFAIIADDVDVDGNADLIVTDYSSQVYVFIGKNAGGFQASSRLPGGLRAEFRRGRRFQLRREEGPGGRELL